MKKYSELAADLFEKGYNCSQSVFAAFCAETGLDFEVSLKLASSFGGGLGRLREVCGAVSGMLMAAGILYGYADLSDKTIKAEHYKLVQTLVLRFKTQFGSLYCRDLLGITEYQNSYIPEDRTRQYYEERPCTEIVKYAAAILDEYMESIE